MLGTNDLKTRFHLPAEDIARGVSVLVENGNEEWIWAWWIGTGDTGVVPSCHH